MVSPPRLTAPSQLRTVAPSSMRSGKAGHPKRAGQQSDAAHPRPSAQPTRRQRRTGRSPRHASPRSSSLPRETAHGYSTNLGHSTAQRRTTVPGQNAAPGRSTRQGQNTTPLPGTPSPRRKRRPKVSRRLPGSSLRRFAQRYRVVIALFLGLCAAGTGILAVAEDESHTVTAVRVSSAVAAGDVLGPQLLEEASIDEESLPEEYVTSIDEALGARAAVPMPAGTVVLTPQLVGPGLLYGQDEHDVAVPVRPADTAMVSMLTPGQRVDIMFSSDAPESGPSSSTLAEGVPVLWTPVDEEDNWLPSGTESGQVVIVAVDPATAEHIAEATHQGRLHLSLVGG